jgi:putative hydrolase of the HAD superfamily
MLVFEKPMLHALRRLPGQNHSSPTPRAITPTPFSKSPALMPVFRATYSVENLRFQPKPMLAGFRTLLRAERLDPKRCIMVEDSLPNLISAKKLGMKTVWVSTSLRQSPLSTSR